MKFVNVILTMAVICVFNASVGHEVFSILKLQKSCDFMRNQNDCIRFISESFRNTCEGKGFDSFLEWQQCCKKLWNLEYIGWGNACDFMEIEESSEKYMEYFGNQNDYLTVKIDEIQEKSKSEEKGILLYGKWTGPYGEGEVFCRKK